MKAIMLTIRLKWFYLTYKGIKTIEVRKSAPKDFVGDVFEVVSKTNFEKDLMEIPENEREFFKQFKGKVGLKFTLNKAEEIKHDNNGSFYYPYGNIRFMTDSLNEHQLLEKSCLLFGELSEYLYPNNYKGYVWHISNLVIFDRPKELGEFNKYGCRQYDNDVCETYGERGHLYTNCFFHLTKAPQSWQFIEVGE